MGEAPFPVSGSGRDGEIALRSHVKIFQGVSEELEKEQKKEDWAPLSDLTSLGLVRGKEKTWRGT